MVSSEPIFILQRRGLPEVILSPQQVGRANTDHTERKYDAGMMMKSKLKIIIGEKDGDKNNYYW